ncbi:MAG TPA: acyl carrier protein [Burkholderiales bacterium]
MDETQILARLRAVLAEKFELDPAQVTPEANLYNDLHLDSIDAVDLVIQLQEMTGKRIRPDEFRSVRTIGDIVAVVNRLLAA